jgi:triosephosphate isomerase (TIM)
MISGLSMRQMLIAGNWKMHGSKPFIADLLHSLKKTTFKSQVAVFAPFVYIPYISELLQSSAIQYGAQTVSQFSQGAYTGEVSVEMLKEFGCRYVLVGHSERRELFGETNDIVAAKFAAAIAGGLTPILCVGETQIQRAANEIEQVIDAQLDAVIAKTGIDAFSQAVIAYEPVWAIGTGLTATPEQAQEIHAYIRQKLGKLNPVLAETIQILYGGSVKANNAKAIFSMPDIDGGLVGGASLKAEEFTAICEAVG